MFLDLQLHKVQSEPGVFSSGEEPEVKRWLVIVQWRLASHDCSSLHVSREFEGYGFLTALIQS